MKKTDLANKIGVKYNDIYRWEVGKSSPTFKQLRDISNVLNVSPDFFTIDDIDKINRTDGGSLIIDYLPYDEMMSLLGMDQIYETRKENIYRYYSYFEEHSLLYILVICNDFVKKVRKENKQIVYRTIQKIAETQNNYSQTQNSENVLDEDEEIKKAIDSILDKKVLDSIFILIVENLPFEELKNMEAGMVQLTEMYKREQKLQQESNNEMTNTRL